MKCFIDDAFIGTAWRLSLCSKSMVTQTFIPAAVQLLQEQGGDQQDVPKQHICQGQMASETNCFRMLSPQPRGLRAVGTGSDKRRGSQCHGTCSSPQL